MEVSVDCLIFYVLQNSIYVQQKKETHSGLKLILNKWWYKIKHYDRIDRQTKNILFLMLKQQNTMREKNYSTLDWKKYSCFNRNQPV